MHTGVPSGPFNYAPDMPEYQGHDNPASDMPHYRNERLAQQSLAQFQGGASTIYPREESAVIHSREPSTHFPQLNKGCNNTYTCCNS